MGPVIQRLKAQPWAGFRKSLVQVLCLLLCDSDQVSPLYESVYWSAKWGWPFFLQTVAFGATQANVNEISRTIHKALHR